MKRVLVVAYFICCISLVSVFAQSRTAVQNQYKFKHLTVDQGLSNNNIRSICQDAKGFIWMATQNGADKFDGQKIVSYRHDPQDSTTISSNYIFSILLDSKNRLWFGSLGGLDLYNSDLNSFVRFSHKDLKGPIGSIESVVEDKEGKLWIAAETGLYSYDLNSLELQFFSNEVGNPHGLPSNQILRLLVDKNNKVWISIMNQGLCIYNQADSTFQCLRHSSADPSTLSSNRIEYIYEDTKANIWAGTLNSGLNLYVAESNSFVRTVPDPGNSYSTRVRAIFEDLKGNFFVGTRAGLYVRNNLTNEFDLYADEGHNFSNLTNNSIRCSFIDKTGTLWIGTFSGGVNYTNLHKKEFVHYGAGKDDDQYLNGSSIYAITEDSKGNLWVGGDNGLNYLDRRKHTFTYYLNDPDDPYSLSYNDVKSLEWDEKGNLWIGTNRGGLNYYNTQTGQFKSYRYDPENPNSISGDKVYGLMKDKDNNLWILTNPNTGIRNSNIDILPNGSDKFIHLKEEAFFGFDQNDEGDVYIGAENGFWIFTRRDSVFRFVSNDTLIDKVNTIRIDSEGKLWVGSKKGLVRYDIEDKSFAWFSEDNGYPIHEVFGVLEDDAKNLWVSTNTGLVKITNIVEDTADIAFRVFDKEDGLQSRQFSYNAFHKCKSGEMAFGGINGFNTFFPNEIIDYPVAPNVVLTDLKIFNTSTPIGEEIRGRIVLEKSISVSDEIELGPKQNVFTLEFAALHYANPESNTFKYKLEGFDQDWRFSEASKNFATYSNLSAGEYIFMVSAANNDGVWNANPVMLKIIIIPPFWETWWFRILAGFTLIGLILAIYFYRVRSISNQNKVLEETVKKRTIEISTKNTDLLEANVLLEEKQEEIVAQKEELEQHRNKLELLVKERTVSLETALAKAKESDDLKSAFLANMSHEIRTPMNAITGFSGLLNEIGLSSEERAEYTHIIQSNSKDLLKIIDEILDLSLIESNQLKLAEETFDLNVIFDHLYSYYFLNNANSKVEVRKNNTLLDLDLKLSGDSVRLKQIVINLMDNAGKYTLEGYIELGAYMDDDNLCLYVEDTGRGIPSKSIDHIFQQFTKVEDDEAGWTQGLGLGLAISQKIADALGGKILVKSAHGKGSTFTLSIPVKKVVTEEEIVVKELREPVPARWHGKTILIAEDVEANYLYLVKVLKNTHTEIIWAKDGEEAVKIATNSANIDLILMDIKMPKLSGYEAAKKIKEHNPEQIIIAQTAYARSQERAKFYDKNFDEYLAKPISPIDLLILLERFL